jgi:UDP-N-acetyl-D-galactosamine dehydrogenase
MKSYNIAIIGLGYVGLPLAVAFSKKNKVIGFDINAQRIIELNNGNDITHETNSDDLKYSLASNLKVTSHESDIEKCSIYIITVPTPINEDNTPDLSSIKSATKLVSKFLKKGDIVIYESTVYPGTTEEICVPILQNESKLKYNFDFFCGYSPERINPGDQLHRLENIVKVTSGSNEKTANLIDQLYNSIIEAGTFKASSIKVAESAKIIENSQRDINIAFMNEISLVFNKLGVDTKEVLEAAGTKWNFLKFTPGLVGGHCIGVDPYYLSYKALKLGVDPKMILAGREINDNYGEKIVDILIKNLLKKEINIVNLKTLILGFTFKENCPDTRNTGVMKVYNQLKSYSINPLIHDPHANKDEVYNNFNIQLIDDHKLKDENFDLIILCVPHDYYTLDFIKKIKSNAFIYDVKSHFPVELVSFRL